MKAHKEQLVVSESDLKVPVDQYMHLVERAMKELSPEEQQAILLRFWNPSTITEIAARMNLTWDEADLLIDIAVNKVRQVIQRQMKTPT